jgi:hypothetical protein
LSFRIHNSRGDLSSTNIHGADHGCLPELAEPKNVITSARE